VSQNDVACLRRRQPVAFGPKTLQNAVGNSLRVIALRTESTSEIGEVVSGKRVESPFKRVESSPKRGESLGGLRDPDGLLHENADRLVV